MREVEKAKKEAEDELAREKGAYESAFSQTSSKLKKDEAELMTMLGDLELAYQRVDAASGEVEVAK